MKKIIYFLPAIIFTVIYGVAILLVGNIEPIVWSWLAMLWGAGILLNNEILWGGILGFIPGAFFVYMGTQETGQIIKETWAGVILILYYLVCMVVCFYKKKHK